ncbi:MAG TPA: ABC transporter ATP-binding protein [Candidatus Sulfotelmatobacter sp.]|nr:ABC transporter ATP-binding protein [Candidatus Sulfotelmatobacter sp.]
MLELEHLSRRYGDRLALDDVSLTVRAGERVGLLGPNGAGKSTLLRIAAGVQPPDSGVVRIAGEDLGAAPIEAKRKLGYAAEEPAFYENLSADEYLAFVSGIRGLDPEASRRRALALAESLGLADRLNEPVRGFSHGMRKKLSFLAAVLHQPPVLLCDEALEGFDAGAALAAKQLLRDMSHDGAAILFSSHVTESIERLCDRVVLLWRGRVARTLERAAWGGPDHGPTPLERELLALLTEN